MLLSFFVAGNPVPKGSFRAFNNGGRPVITNNNPRTKDWEMRIAHEAQTIMFEENWPPAMEKAVEIMCIFHLPRPKSLKKGFVPHTKRPDIDKLARAVLDGITGVIIKDDSQVVGIHCTKMYANENDLTGVDVHISMVEPY